MKQGKSIDLDNPKDARLFLRGVRFEGKKVYHIYLDDGRTLDIDLLTDDQAVRYAKDIYFDYCGGVEGKGGHIELDLEGQDQ